MSIQMKSAWFVERKDDRSFPAKPYKRWLKGFDYDDCLWTNDPNEAIRFCRRQDAEKLCISFGLPEIQRYSPFASEHLFTVLAANASPRQTLYQTLFDEAIELDDSRDIHECAEYAAKALEYILSKVLNAADVVLSFDWRENDEDAVAAIEGLRDVMPKENKLSLIQRHAKRKGING